MYAALKYIGREYTPGEILPDDLDKTVLERLIRSGAVKKIPEGAEEPAVDEGAETAEAREIAPPAGEEPEEAETEPEAPVIDVTEALVTGEEKPKRKAKKGGKGR